MTRLSLQLATASLLAALALHLGQGTALSAEHQEQELKQASCSADPAAPHSEPAIRPERLEVRQLAARVFEVVTPRPDPTPSPCTFDTRLLPERSDGGIRGVRITQLLPDSDLDRLALRSGDVVLLVNGLPIGTPEEALRAYTELRRASVIVVDLERSGSAIRHVYIVR